ncbi:hypothetical protein L1049_017130 [Liquidambar formosana]|uniref:Uncharacterized protein n=1 Tax=Liquidambar formosana TaxID=63359 RepID=A0AAP0X129_LIQFO
MLPRPAPEGLDQVLPPSALEGGDQVPPPLAVASSVGHPPYGPATSVHGISGTTLLGQDVPPIHRILPPASPEVLDQMLPPPAIASSAGPSLLDPATSVQRNPSSFDNGIPDTTLPLEQLHPVDRDSTAGRMLRITKELMRTAILDPALSALANFLLKALVDENIERAYCIVFMAAILLLLRKYSI